MGLTWFGWFLWNFGEFWWCFWSGLSDVGVPKLINWLFLMVLMASDASLDSLGFGDVEGSSVFDRFSECLTSFSSQSFLKPS